MKVEIVPIGAFCFDWEPVYSSHSDRSTCAYVRELGNAAYPKWFPNADDECSFNRRQIDLLAAVLRLHGIEVIER